MHVSTLFCRVREKFKGSGKRVYCIPRQCNYCLKNLKNFWRKNFFRTTTPPPRQQLFRENIFPDVYVTIAFQRLYLNFSYQVLVLCEKNKYLALCAEIFHPKKWLGPNKQFLGAPRTWGPGAISLSHDDEYPPFVGGIQFSLTNADN